MYASEIDGSSYICACRKTNKHSNLLSSRDGYVNNCCRSSGWDYFSHNGIMVTKKPQQTREEVMNDSDKYSRWLIAGMPGYMEGISYRDWVE